MAYEKHNWVNGETITDTKLNHMEDGIATGGGMYSCSDVVLFDGSVTTEDMESYFAGVIELLSTPQAKPLKVVLNGQSYVLPYVDLEGNNCWGEVNDGMPSLENYPLFIGDNADETYAVATESAGTYTLKITQSVLTFSDDFKGSLPKIVRIKSVDRTLNMTYNEIITCINEGAFIYVAGHDFYEYFNNYNNAELTLQFFEYDSMNNSCVGHLYKATSEDDYPGEIFG